MKEITSCAKARFICFEIVCELVISAKTQMLRFKFCKKFRRRSLKKYGRNSEKTRTKENNKKIASQME